MLYLIIFAVFGTRCGVELCSENVENVDKTLQLDDANGCCSRTSNAPKQIL